jgi:hypothetical protein
MTKTITQPLFVRLHDADGNTDVIVNANDISVITTVNIEGTDRKGTEITFNEASGAETLIVNETPVKIYDMLMKSTSASSAK